MRLSDCNDTSPSKCPAVSALQTANKAAPVRTALSSNSSWKTRTVSNDAVGEAAATVSVRESNAGETICK